jgi:ribonucleoside-triphosphate reductase
LRKRGGGLFGANPLTGSIGVVTMNMARVGFLSKNEDDFFQRLENNMELAKQSLEIKREILEGYTKKGLFPYSKFYLRYIYKSTKQYWKNHFSTIGLVGMNDALLNFMDEDIASKKGRKFALKVLDFMRDKLADYQQLTGNIYNLEATPAEGTSYRLAKRDLEYNPKIRVYNLEKYKGKEPYYTNSTQLPVGYTDDIFEALRLQDDLQVKYTGGTVLHGFVGEKMPSIESTKKLVKRISENFHLPYFTITPTFSVCPQHGYLPGEHGKCPSCNSRCEVYSRIVGYLRPVEQWNDGKQEEFENRKVFSTTKAK